MTLGYASQEQPDQMKSSFQVPMKATCDENSFRSVLLNKNLFKDHVGNTILYMCCTNKKKRDLREHD